MKTLTFEKDGHIGIITLNRPNRLNALSQTMVRELHVLFNTLDEDLDARVLILTGAGRGFCAGADLRGGDGEGAWDERLGPIQSQYRLQQGYAALILRLRQIPQPIIAAVNGPAAGGGFCLALASDVRYASESARFNCAFIKLGLSAGEMGSSYFLPRIVGASHAAELMYTGRIIDAKTALEIGLVSKVVPDGEVLPAAKELAREMLSNAPLALRMTKEVYNFGLCAPSLENQIHMENRTQVVNFFTDDFREGAMSFLEKRPPQYGDK
ncbi:MAG: enoyl-CoA hydratase/isomerase family protein [Candidatus Abyssobacteria bacterium SURF_17]|uniref:Enoyl-CoA hydratase/isomerase family protein n=1 Tax=Candidatus Abyssobacteria bacterium SURF_17 TaxID=2093361 RepID=A0A419EX49_9BACT|nr:MAG: enoyl-CoA hydratase/isomerase family protein [Candidatus Abyssubacteria bacterium SURF_17]